MEKEDKFSPDPLNENVQRVEAELAALDDADAALDARVTLLEAKKIVAGTYVGNGSILTVELDFTPRAVLAQTPNSGFCGFATAEQRCVEIKIVENGFQVNSGSTNQVNSKGVVNFIAFA